MDTEHLWIHGSCAKCGVDSESDEAGHACTRDSSDGPSDAEVTASCIMHDNAHHRVHGGTAFSSYRVRRMLVEAFTRGRTVEQ